MSLAELRPPPPALERAPSRYARRDPERTTLHRVVREHFDSFLARAAERDGHGLPTFVRRALQRYLDCGVLQKGFCRFRCDGCGFDHLVALSCKGRGFCPSCGGRRMTELSAHLVDQVIPFVPVRQYVLSLPPRLRYLLAYDHARCSAVLRIVARALRGFERARAARAGVDGGHTGAVTFIQRFGSAANLNLHFHVIALDGVFSEQEGALRFHPARPLQNEEVAALLATVRARVERWLERAGLLDPGAHDELADEAPLLAEAYATSILGQSTLERPRAPIRRLGVTERPARVVRARALHAHDQGFDLDAGVRIAAQHPEQREPLEKLLRYCARPPLADDRLELRADGRIALTLKTPWHDGTTQLELAPLDLLARCAALIPRPHKNLVVYHGVLAANARLRPRVVGYGRPAEDARAGAHADAPHGTCARAADSPAEPEPAATPRSSRARASWADLMRRAFGHELLRCPRCGATMRWLATILDHQTIARILRHLGLPSEPVARAPARASPTLELFGDDIA